MVVEMSIHIDLITAPLATTAGLCTLTGYIAALSIYLSTEREQYCSASKFHKRRCHFPYSGMAFWFVDKPRS
jgi:hypothetical protein